MVGAAAKNGLSSRHFLLKSRTRLVLIFSYILPTLLTFLLVQRFCFRLNSLVALSLSCGIGPAAYIAVLEYLIFFNIAPSFKSVSLTLLFFGLAISLIVKVKDVAFRPAFVVSFCLLALTSVLTFSYISNFSIALGWDQTTYRLLGERVLAENVIKPSDLILLPSKNDVQFVAGFHGLKYALMLSQDKLFGSIGVIFWDVVPTQWYLMATLSLAVASIYDFFNKEKFIALIASLFCFSILITNKEFLLWPLFAKEGSIFVGFFLLAVLVSCIHLLRNLGCEKYSFCIWLLVGSCIGLSLGFHRTALILFMCPTIFGIFFLYQKRISALWPMSGFLAGLCVFLMPYFLWLQIEVPSLNVANPTSAGLEPYRQPWRDVFEGSKFELAYSQFWLLEKGAIVWVGAFLSTITFFSKQIHSFQKAKSNHFLIALHLTVISIAIGLADMSFLIKDTGLSELIIRSHRYRQAVVPALAIVFTITLFNYLSPKIERLSINISAKLTNLFFNSNFKLFVISFCLSISFFLSFVYLAEKYRLGDSWIGYWDVKERVNTLFLAKETTIFNRRFVDLPAILELEKRYLEMGSKTKKYVSLDFMPMLTYLTRPVRTYWLTPGLFNLYDARTQDDAYKALKHYDIDTTYLIQKNLTNEIYSSTGVRHGWSLRNMKHSYDGENIDDSVYSKYRIIPCKILSYKSIL